MSDKMLNFTVGPVMSCDEVLEVTGQSAPYFRTPEFSEIMKENEAMMMDMLSAPEGSRVAFLTASGTGAMESAVMNILDDSDKVIVVNGGSFGQRFADLCALHKREFSEIKLEFGKALEKSKLSEYTGKGYTALLINMCETSSGVLYDMQMVSDFCKENGILLIVDAISSFLADELDMDKLGVAAVITSSQKALALHPGISMITMSPKAIERVEANEETCMYLSLKEALKNGKRGQTPFTPAVAILLSLNARLHQIDKSGGRDAEHERIVNTAKRFREGIKGLPLDLFAESMSNCVTALRVRDGSAKDVVNTFKDKYQIWLCPNGGKIGNTVFRVGHIGSITAEDNSRLISAFKELFQNAFN